MEANIHVIVKTIFYDILDVPKVDMFCLHQVKPRARQIIVPLGHMTHYHPVHVRPSMNHNSLHPRRHERCGVDETEHH
jgi:hypothetical protein